MKRTRTSDLTTVFSCFVTCIPILQYYVSPLSVFNLATLLVLLFAAIFMVMAVQRGRYRSLLLNRPMTFYVLFIFLNVVLTSYLFKYSYSWTNVSPFIRLLLLYFSLIVLGGRFFDVRKAFQFMENLLFWSAIFITLHLVAYSVAHISLRPIIFPLVTQDSLNLDIHTARTGGFYMEPAHYAQSVVLYLCYKLFPLDGVQQKMSKKTWMILIGLLFSGSGQGYALCTAVYGIWLLSSMARKNVSRKKMIIFFASIILGVVALFFVLQIPFVQNAVSRIVTIDENGIKLGGSALAGRSYTNHYFHEFDSRTQMTGVGFGHIAEVTRGGYTNSLYAHLIQCGYPSVVLLYGMLLFYFIKGPVCLKVHAIIYAAMITFSAMANPMNLCFFMMFYIALCKQKRPENRKRRIHA